MAKKRKTRIKHAEVVELFAARLKEMRLNRGMTQVQLARLANVATAYVGRLENTESAPSIDTVQRLAAALGCTIHDLLPLGPPPSEVAVLKDQVRRQVEILLETNDAQSLALVVQFLARVVRTSG